MSSAEYEAMGEDVDAIQMDYIKISPACRDDPGMALITMLCSGLCGISFLQGGSSSWT